MTIRPHIRINKFLSEIGYCSRREADKLIEQGRVRINGEVPLLGTKITREDEVEIRRSINDIIQAKNLRGKNAAIDIFEGFVNKPFEYSNGLNYNIQNGKARPTYNAGYKSNVISIKNSNPGISESNLDQLFERFQRGDASAAGGVGHAGIGLSLCKRITETINGQLVATADSEWFMVTVKIPSAQI